MNNRNFRAMLEEQWSRGNFVCVGLDSAEGDRMCAVVDATHDLVCAYKPNSAFYEARGVQGMATLRSIIAHIHCVAPNVPVILDAKRADIGNTNAGYVDAAFEVLEADAITVHPYLGAEALEPFLEREEKGVIVLCRTSNPGAGEFQDLSVNGEPLYLYVARRVASQWNRKGNCALVVGATYPDELCEVRGVVGDMPILVPGIGAQGGDLEKTVSAGRDSRGKGMIINSSRGIIFSPNPRQATIELRDAINQYR